MIDIHRLKEAALSLHHLHQTLGQKSQEKRGIEKMRTGACAMREALASTRKELEAELNRYLGDHPALISHEPGLRDIFRVLVAEEQYSGGLAWLMAPTTHQTFGRKLLGKMLAKTHTREMPEAGQLLNIDYTVDAEYGVDVGSIDILVRPKNSREFLILIENKILEGTKEGVADAKTAGQQPIRQLMKYEEWARASRSSGR